MNQSSAFSRRAARPRIEVVRASWHRDIDERAHDGINAEMVCQGVDPDASLTHLAVPGAFGLPLHAKKLAESGYFDAVIACGLIVDGASTDTNS